jgi:biotin-dependent carboxylase-like uncharacterized protein
MIRILRAPAYATVQDSGRTGFRAAGVPRAGAMDAPALNTLNAMLGNSARCAAIEWALAGGTLAIDAGIVFAVGGAAASATLSGKPIEMWQPHHAAAGDLLELSPPERGRFSYLAIAGGVETPVVMGSRSTYTSGGFGGHEGRRLKNGDVVAIGAPAGKRRHQVSDALPEKLRPPFSLDVIRYVAREGVALARDWKISAASDRTGYRLESDVDADGESITSECVGPGVIQLPPGGSPIVLMADAPTIGGYRIAGGVISHDLGAFAQRVPGDAIALEPVSVEHAQRELERDAERLETVREWSLA